MLAGLVRRQLQLTLDLYSSQTARLDLVRALRIASLDRLARRPSFLFNFVHTLGEARFRVDESFSSVTHAPDYTDLESICATCQGVGHARPTNTGRRRCALSWHILVYDSRMAAPASFDITSTVDLQEIDNALNQARKEVGQRYDFKGSKASIEFDPAASKLVLVADDNFKLDALWEILQTRLVRRSVPTQNFTRGVAQPAANSTVRQEVAMQQGITSEAARDIVKFIKEAKLRKVQPTIQGDQLRITSSSKDELQDVMRLLREQDFGLALQFGNYRG